MQSIAMALKGARATLSAASIESASLDASLILSYLTHYTKVQLITHDDELLGKINQQYGYVELLQQLINK